MENLKMLVRSTLWAIRPEAAASAIIQLTRSPGDWEAARPSTVGKGYAKLGIVPVQGVLTKDGPAWYGSNYDAISSALEQHAADPEVKRIVLAVDSPGGEVIGLPETANLISQVAKVKPVSAIVEGQAASAAYWLTSQAGDITLTPSGEVGSVGVRMMHADLSKMYEDAGIKITEIYAGDYKTEWSPFHPLSAAAQEDMTARLASVHQDFISAVAGGRGARASADMTTTRFGEGRMFSADVAKEHGMVDSIQSSRDFYRSIMPPVEQELSAPVFPIRRAVAELEIRRARVK